MLKLRTGRVGLIALGVLLLTLGALYLLRGGLTLVPWERSVTLEAPSAITATPDGGFLVIDIGSRRVLRLDADGQCSDVLTATTDEVSSFQFVQAAVARLEGGFYLRDLVWQENGMDVAQERIFFCNESGSGLRTVYTIDAVARGEIYHKPRLWGPFYRDGAPCFAELRGDTITLRRLPDGNEMRVLQYPNAETAISDCTMDNVGRLYLVDKRGAILKEEENGAFTTLYQGGGEIGPNCSVPWGIAVSSRGTVVFSDLGSRSIQRVADGRALTLLKAGEVTGAPTEVADAPILYQVDVAEDGRICLAYGGSIYVRAEDGTVVLNTDKLVLTDRLVVVGWLAFLILDAALIAAVAAVICLSICALRAFRPGLSTKVGALVMCSMLIAMAIVFAVAFRTTEDRYVEEIFSRMLSTAQGAGRQLDLEALEAIQSPQDYGTPAYERLRASLERAVDRDYEWNRQLYCNVYIYRAGILFSPIYLDQTTGAFYPLEDEGQREVMETGEAKRFYMTQTSSGTWMYIFSPLYGRDGNAVGVLDVGIDMNAYQKQMIELYLKVIFSVLAACAVVQLLVIQVMGVVEFFRARRARVHEAGKPAQEPIGFIRPIVFLIFFAFNLPTAFLPNFCTQFNGALLGLPQEFLRALPVSLNLLATACGSFGSGLALERFEPRRVGTFGGAMAAAAYLGIALAQEYVLFTLCMALAGAGLGAALNALNACIAMREGGEERTEGFAIYNSAYFSGVNSGAVVGALLAAAVGERVVFALVGLCLVVPAALLWRWMHDERPRHTEEQEEGGVGLVQFLTNFRMLVFLLLGYLPYMVAGHFLFYFLPVFGGTIGLDSTAISQLFLVNGICVLVTARFTSELFINRMDHAAAARCALVLVGGAFLIFSFVPNTAGAVLAVIVLSLADSFGRSAMNLCFSEQKISRRYGSGRAMGVFSLFENVGETAGPVVFGFLLAGDPGTGFRLLSSVYGVCATVLLLTRRRGTRILKKRKGRVCNGWLLRIGRRWKNAGGDAAGGDGA